MLLNDELKSKLNRAISLRNEIEKMSNELDEIKSYLNAQTPDQTLETDDGTIVYEWKTYSGSEKFDSKLFKKDHPDLYSQYVTIGVPSVRAYIKTKLQIS